MALDLKKLRRYSIFERRSKVGVDNMAEAYRKGSSLGDFFRSIPPVLGGKDLLFLIEKIRETRSKGRRIIFGMGAHVLKVGLSPLVNQLVERGFVDHMAVTGAFLVHDVELAIAGITSEDVPEQLKDGSFGMAEETSRFLNEAIREGVAEGHGLGFSVASKIERSASPHKERSVLAGCVSSGVGVSVHVAVGTDINHMHPEADGESIGAGSLRDFHLFTERVMEMEGGVYLNIGSAVVLPEVFLKAISLARNLGHPLEDITTGALDFIRHYRVMENVVKRPTQERGRGVYIVAQHEILFPLLAAGLIEKDDE